MFTSENLNNIPNPKISDAPGLSELEITPKMVYSKLKKLNPNKSPGNDKRHPYFLKQLSECICVPLSIFFNKSLNEGVHKSWLHANITPIYKKRCKRSTV